MKELMEKLDIVAMKKATKSAIATELKRQGIKLRVSDISSISKTQTSIRFMTYLKKDKRKNP